MAFNEGDRVQFENWEKEYCRVCGLVIETMYLKVLALASMTVDDNGIRTVVDDGRFVKYPEGGKCEDCDPNCVLAKKLTKKS
ncbi:MAG: hypothetical protein UU93_C0008G0012 [Candidatus Amesbacteria bacterium GW2011_GWA2_42_12]|uniref:Uncharacterized protein n=1 Tax=Candidatus Amesbacteria bacterium GW2011_GWA2_42_12 TaxID=1618356 RepID=A0A0G0Y6A0_9BACT|nr:MAG: hypothetical protein UU93_C0008G0012 [Candidatus Amesbacteria bacterium GW2011_GWA2_42_12]